MESHRESDRVRRQVLAVCVEGASMQLGSAFIRKRVVHGQPYGGVAVGMIGTAAIRKTQLKEALHHAGG